MTYATADDGHDDALLPWCCVYGVPWFPRYFVDAHAYMVGHSQCIHQPLELLFLASSVSYWQGTREGGYGCALSHHPGLSMMVVVWWWARCWW